jgi:hypothetical protein
MEKHPKRARNRAAGVIAFFSDKALIPESLRKYERIPSESHVQRHVEGSGPDHEWDGL